MTGTIFVASKSKKSIYKSKLFWFLIIYAGLLVCSAFYRYALRQAPAAPTAAEKKSVRLTVVPGEAGRSSTDRIRVTYRDYPPAPNGGGFPVVLIHGSPGSAGAFAGLAEVLDDDRRLIAIDLPGFGDSEKNIPDYSIKAHALYLLELLDRLEIERAHLVGFSLGGGVALHVADLAPERVASVAFISSIGVQEYELLGEYHANRTAHAAQLAAFWFLRELTPHFGLFDDTIPYARNFFDTDQRPLRGMLRRVEMPFLIIHGRTDPLVPVEAAREHRRIVPQSRYVELEDNHFFIFRRPGKLKKPLEEFWQKTETGRARRRPEAAAERIALAGRPFEYRIIPARGITAFVFFLLLVLIAVLLSADAALLLAGTLAAQGRFGFLFALTACLAGLWLGGLGAWLIGRRLRQTRFFGRCAGRQKHGRQTAPAADRPAPGFGKIFLDLLRPFSRSPLSVSFAAGGREKFFWTFAAALLTAAPARAVLLTGSAYLAGHLAIGTGLTGRTDTFFLFAFVCAFYAVILPTLFFFRRKRLM